MLYLAIGYFIYGLMVRRRGRTLRKKAEDQKPDLDSREFYFMMKTAVSYEESGKWNMIYAGMAFIVVIIIMIYIHE